VRIEKIPQGFTSSGKRKEKKELRKENISKIFHFMSKRPVLAMNVLNNFPIFFITNEQFFTLFLSLCFVHN
jgi:hypothetical protein